MGHDKLLSLRGNQAGCRGYGAAHGRERKSNEPSDGKFPRGEFGPAAGYDRSSPNPTGGKKAERLSVAPAQQGHVDMQDLSKALDMLLPHQREAVVLVGAAGMSYEEAAEIAKCPVGTMKSRVYRARVKLAEHFDVDGPAALGPDWATGGG